MTTVQAHESEFREHAHPAGSSSAEGMALDHHVNGDASQHNAIPEFAPPQPEPTEVGSSDQPPTKSLQASPSAHADVAIPEQTYEPASMPVKESTPPVILRSETHTTADDPVIPAAITTTTVEMSAPESLQDPVSMSSEAKVDADASPKMQSEVGQPFTSDERNAPLEVSEAVVSVAPAETPLVEPPQDAAIAPVDAPPTTLPEAITSLESTAAPITALEPTAAPVVEATEIVDVKDPQISSASEILTPAPPAEVAMATVDDKMEDVVQGSVKIAREREEDDEEDGPDAKRTKTEVEVETIPPSESAQPDVEAPVPTIEPTSESAVITEEVIQDVPMTTPAPDATDSGVSGALPTSAVAADNVAAAAEGAAAAASAEAGPPVDWGPMTDAQSRQLKQNIQNLKKGKHATSFSKPVDPVALKIPTYYDVVKTPMDLSTMEQKLKDGKYASVNDFVADFNLIVDNCIAFNGRAHAVSVAGLNLQAQFMAGLRKVPKAGEVVQPAQKKQRRSSFALPQRETKRRESRPSLGGATATSPTGNANTQTFALGQDGVPLTRRISHTDGRPKREIHKPPPRDLPYLSAKPKKKKFQMELKFCEHVLGELKRGRYGEWMTPFANPVDPVALNIPDYHKYIKKPMDFRTITEKLHNGQYENAKEFEADVRLVFSNCYKFNGPTHPIAQSGKALEQVFDELWGGKQAWISQNTPASAPQSPEAESESEEEEEEDEEDEEEDERAAQIASLQEKIAELSAQAVALTTAPAPKKVAKPGKKKSEKGNKKGAAATTKPAKVKSGNLSTPASSKKTAPKKQQKAKQPTKPKPITMAEKSEIAERIGELSMDDTSKAAEYIKEGLRKINSPLADRPDEELEFDIDQIPDDVLRNLLKLVRKNDPPAPEPKRAAPSAKTASASKPKKNKPMGKVEQEDAIRRLTDQIESFQNPNQAGEAVAGQDDASSGDEDDSGSESEEE